MISIRNLTVFYGKKNVLNALNLPINTKLIHGIIGLNGAGKTTLLNTIFGLKKATSGTILNNNIKVDKTQVAYLPTENFFYSDITGNEYLNLFKNETFNTIKWNKLFDLPLDSIIDNYSTGMKKKLALIATLKQNKPIIILDEPFNGLDIVTCRIIRTVLLRLKDKGKTIIITSHIMETLTNLCDYIHYLENGTIKLTSNKHNFKQLQQEIFTKIENDNVDLINELF